MYFLVKIQMLKTDTIVQFSIISLFLGEMVLAGSFSGWYWTLDKDGPMENVGVMSSFYRTCRFHLGNTMFKVKEKGKSKLLFCNF